MDASIKRHLSGFDYVNDQRVSLRGDRLCETCYVEMRDEIAEHIPMPPGRPGGYIVARSRHLKTVDKGTGITIAWCRGDLCRAVRVHRSKSARVARYYKRW